MRLFDALATLIRRHATGRAFRKTLARNRAAAEGLDAAVREVLNR